MTDSGSNEIDSYDLFWYRERSCDGLVENLGPGSGEIETTNSERIMLQGIANLNNAPFSEEMPGEYWCQAVITNSSGKYLATRSNVLTVLRPENYTGLSVCSSVQFTDASKCAYPPILSTCNLYCISETIIPTTCILPISTMEDSAKHSPIKDLVPTKSLNSSAANSASTNSVSEETNSNEQPVSSSKSAYLPSRSIHISLHRSSEIFTPTTGTNLYISRMEENFVYLCIKSTLLAALVYLKIQWSSFVNK